ncbi:uncharacterized protein G2W53_039563 [Senna tora]|uniref:Uncharacterized protein n=1 Tax=Senna tora TaxID=362788 RepID=A0A834SPP2_9FABA|nr:uncharacterized protein G2W53_039563 [Senna tora]
MTVGESGRQSKLEKREERQACVCSGLRDCVNERGKLVKSRDIPSEGSPQRIKQGMPTKTKVPKTIDPHAPTALQNASPMAQPHPTAIQTHGVSTRANAT